MCILNFKNTKLSLNFNILSNLTYLNIRKSRLYKNLIFDLGVLVKYFIILKASLQLIADLYHLKIQLRIAWKESDDALLLQ